MSIHDPSLARLLDELCRRDFQTFLERVFHTIDPGRPLERNWHLDAMCAAATEVFEGRDQRLLITIPPRYMKSVTFSVAFPAWAIGRDPTLKIITASYGQELSLAHARSFRRVVRSAWYAKVFPTTAQSVLRDTESQWHTRQGGFRWSLSLGGAFTGLGADIIIVDDMMNAKDASSPVERERVKRFYNETLITRLDDKRTGRIIAIQQRLHEDDLAGHLLDKGLFKHLNLPAIAERDETIALGGGRNFHRRLGEVLNPAREPRGLLDHTRAEMGARAFAAQYQQNPTPSESDHFRWDNIQFYDVAPPRDRLQSLVQSWDTALAVSPTADWSVCSTWGFDGQAWLLLEVTRWRLSYPDLLAKVRAERQRWRTNMIIVEASGVGIPLLKDLAQDMRCLSDRRHHAPNCQRHGYTPKLGKEERLASQVERLYSGHAKFPRQAPWLEDLKREFMAFPAGRHDDQVDSVTQFLEWSLQRSGRRQAAADSRSPSQRRP